MSNFQVGSSLLAIGITWRQAFGASLVGHFLAATLVVSSSYPGLYYNISFPVATRMAWGKLYQHQLFWILLTLARLFWFHLRGAEQNPSLCHLVRRSVMARRIDDIRLSACNVAIH